MKNLLKHHKWILFSIILVAALGIAVPVLADYLGPNRTVTTTVSVCKVVLKSCMYVESKGEYRYHTTDSWSCSNESKPWQAYPSNGGACPPGKDHWSREESTETTTVTYDPATISGSLQNCTLQNGWCVSPPTLSLSANEPLAGYSITLIEGTYNGVTFACPSGETNCSLPLNEGENNFTYWALSSWGDSSAMGASTARVDTVAPSVGLDISGTSGANGWYVSPITITATGDDATPGSGVASRLLSVNGGDWQASTTLTEGVYQVDVTVFDNAGNVSTSSATLSVDTTTPTIDVAVSGTLGKHNYYTSVIQVAAVPTDATSGVASFEVSADGAAYQSYTPISLNDGPHTIQFRAVDAAGNVTGTPLQTFYVDTLAPTVNLPASWQLGTNVPYDVIDEGSGLAALRIVIEDEDEKYAKVAWNQEVSGSTYSQDIDWNGQFKDKTVAPPGTYLVWIKASDLAGNERFQLGKVIVPETNLFLNLLPTEAPAVSAAIPEPPAELSEPEALLPVTAPPAAGFGGETTQPGEVTKQSLLLATGSAGAASATTTSGILWGAAAVTAISAATTYALDTTRKRQEAEEAQAARVKAEVARSKAERAEKQQKQQENYAKQKALEQAIQVYQQKKKQEAAYNARMEEKMTKFEEQEETAWVAAQAAITKKQEEKKKAEAAAAKNAQMLASLPSYFQSEKQAKKNETIITAAPPMCVAVPEKKKPWWEKAIDTTVDFIGGAVYQWGRNNMDALAIVNPLPGKEKYFRDMANADAQTPDTPAFQWGRLVGSIAGIVQGVWEMASGIATATGGTVISCGTVILCIGGGGVSLAAGAALVLHGAAVTGTSIYQTGKLFNEMSSSPGGEYNSGAYKNYKNRSTPEIQKAIRSYEKQVQLHQDKIANPEKYVPNWNQLSPERQRYYIQGWQDDITRNQDLANVMKTILGERGEIP